MIDSVPNHLSEGTNPAQINATGNTFNIGVATKLQGKYLKSAGMTN